MAFAMVAALFSLIPNVTAAGPRGLGEPAPVDAQALPELPVRGQWGVSDQDPAALHNFENYVWDFTEIGDRMYVAGSFRKVQGSRNGEQFDQPYLAAFDLYTGAWIPEFAPQLNGPVFALEVSPLGFLIAGGQFTAAFGRPNTAGLVGLDPGTGAIDTRFQASVQRPFSTEVAVVRSLEVVGDALYVAGNFSHVRGNSDTQRVRVFKAARVNARWGTPDGTWKPNIAGSGVYGFGIDTGRGRMHLAGFFSSVSGAPNTASVATVDLVTGALVPNQRIVEENITIANRPRKYWDVEFAGDRVWLGGEEHILQVLRGSDRQRLGYHTTGAQSTGFRWVNYFSGGDFQVVEQIGDWIFAGCHCTYETRTNRGFSGRTWYDSFSNERKPIKLLGAIDVGTGRALDWSPDLAGSREGVWAVHADSLGCLWAGGQFDVAGVEAGSAFWVGNMARFCPPGVDVGADRQSPTAPADLIASTRGPLVDLAWQGATDNRAVTGYIVVRDGVEIATVTGTTFADTPGDGWHDYRVRAIDAAGNRSGNSNTVSVNVISVDAVAPSVPAGLVGVVQGSDVGLTWQPSTDDVGVDGYAVYRDGRYVGWASTVSFVDVGRGAIDGTHRYDLRAYDRAGNRSAKSAAVSVTVGEADTVPPSVPAGLSATVEGSTVALNWAPSTDDVRLDGYAVYRNGAYIGWARTTTFTDLDVPAGTWRYDLRAYDVAGNRSAKSVVATAVVG